jgi:hypothetical protein
MAQLSNPGGYEGIDLDLYKPYFTQDAFDRMDLDEEEDEQDEKEDQNEDAGSDADEEATSSFELDSSGEARYDEELAWTYSGLEEQEALEAEEERKAEEASDEYDEDDKAFFKAEGFDASVFDEMKLVCLSYGLEEEGRFDPYRQIDTPGEGTSGRGGITDYLHSMYETKQQALRCLVEGWGSERWHKRFPATRLDPEAFWFYDASTGLRIDETKPIYRFLRELKERREGHLQGLSSPSYNFGYRGGVDHAGAKKRDFHVEDKLIATVFLVVTRAGVALPQMYEHVRIVHLPAGDYDSGSESGSRDDEEDRGDHQEIHQKNEQIQVVYDVYKQNIWSLPARRVRRHLAKAQPAGATSGTAEAAASAGKKKRKVQAPKEKPRALTFTGTGSDWGTDYDAYKTDDEGDEDKKGELKIVFKGGFYEGGDRTRKSVALEKLLDPRGWRSQSGLLMGNSYMPLVFLGLQEGGSIRLLW